jgi:hypothetical protein
MTLDESLLDPSLYYILLVLISLPLHLLFYPVHHLESKQSVSLAYINTATPQTHDSVKRDAGFSYQQAPDPSSDCT